MKDNNAIINDVKEFQFAVPLSRKELNEINSYCKNEGLKKGALVRKAIFEYLKKVEDKNGE